MAKQLWIVGGMVGAFWALVGCQPHSATQAFNHASFDAPRMAVVTPAPLPVPVAPPPVIRHVEVVKPTITAFKLPFKPPTTIVASAGWVPPVAPRPWRYIVIHHSDTTVGGAAAFDRMHRAKGWDELGYDFVIGNGTDTGNGQIEVGPRWTKQKIGAHAKTADNMFNEYGIGICLVGNFMVQHPTDRQMESLDKLVAYLMETYNIPADHIVGHGDTKSTDCPGKLMSVAAVRTAASKLIGLDRFNRRTAMATELLHDDRR